MILKQIKYILLLIIVSCSSSSKEIDFQELSISAVKSELLDPNSFELIKYSLDTIFLHEGARRNISNDSMELAYAMDYAMSIGEETYEDRRIKEDIIKYERSIDSNESLIKNAPDTIVKYLGYVRYYANSKDGRRLINSYGITFNHKGLYVSQLSLD